MADKRISQLIERTDIANNDVLPIVASGATTTNKVTISTIQEWMQDNLDVGVTSVGITIGSTGTDINVTGSPITTSGNITINIPTASATNRGLLSSSDWTSFNSKLSSVGLTMPSAFTVSNSPLTANGTIAVTGAGTVAQYIRGDGSLADFPEAGGGGASVSYYLNGSVSQGTIGGIAYMEMNKTPILGAGTDFTINADGYIASFITDAGDPSLLEIPGGNWNFETYFQASSGGGTPTFYVELYKVSSGGTATLIATSSGSPELIAFGTNITPYFSSLAVPTTTLALTDRLAIRYYVAHSGRTITLHTENNTLCQIITTFTTGLTALNGLTAQVQNFATGTSGTDFNISSASTTHTFNLPDASATARGAVTTGSQVFGGVKTFANGLSLPSAGGSNQVTRIVNIGTLHEGSATLNQIGFNSANNIYFGKGLSNGGVLQWTNSAVRYYTFPDADGTLALASQLGAYLPLAGGTLTGALNGTSAVFSGDVQSGTRLIAAASSQSILLTPNSGGTTNRVESVGTLPLALVSGAAITMAAGGTTPQITLATSGAVTLTGALNGTSASFSGAITSLAASGTGVIIAEGTATNGEGLVSVRGKNSSGTSRRADFKYDNADVIRIATASPINMQFETNDTTRLTINGSTGAATFSSSVTAGGNIRNTFLSLRDDSIEQYATDSDTVGPVINYLGFNGGNTRFRNFSVFNGKEGLLFRVVGSSGNVGIGTASPSQRLTVSGGYISQVDGGVSTFLGYDGTGSLVGTTTNHYLRFITNDTERMRITSGGNVGIGTASPTTYSLGGRHLELNDAGGGYAFIHSNTTSVKSFFAANESGSLAALFTFSNHPLTFGTNNTERMRITSSGNVGIGTASPTAKLHVAGDILIPADGRLYGNSATVTGSRSYIEPYNASTGDMNLVTGFSTASIVFGTQQGTERMRITSGGSILFGTQTMSTTHAYFDNAGSSRMVLNLGSSVTTNANLIAFNNPNGNVGTIATSGSSTSYNTTSDYRLKENVNPVQNALSVLTQLKPCTFNFIADAEEEVMGFIAHEVQEIVPQAVTGEKDAIRIQQVEVSPAELDEGGNIITEAVIEEKEVPVYQGIDHSKLVPLLVASIQELKAEIEALKSQING